MDSKKSYSRNDSHTTKIVLEVICGRRNEKHSVSVEKPINRPLWMNIVECG
jgi:hypothetical protein